MWELGTIITTLFGVLGLVFWYYGSRELSYQPRISILWYVIAVHILRGVLLLNSPEPAHITTIHTIVSLDLASVHGIGVLYLTVASLAIQGLFIKGRAAVPFLIPQGIVLLVAAYGALRAMILGTYADGVVRSPLFIMADQSPAVVIAVLYTLLLILLATERTPSNATSV